MNWQLNNSPIIPIHPGEILKRELKERGIKQSEFASKVGLRPSHLSEILNGSRSINDQLALRLEDILDMKAELWLRLQAVYNRNQKEIETLEIVEQQAINELRAYNESIDIRTVLKRHNYLHYCNGDKLKFLTEKMMLPSSAELAVISRGGGLWRKSSKVGIDSRMINTWAYMARYAVKSISPTGVFHKEKTKELVSELVKVFNENKNTTTRVTEIFSKYGIKFCIVEKIDKASIDGYSFLDNGIPAIVVTCRIPKIDSLAFSILHELGHHILHINDSNDSFISYDGPNDDVLESEADKFASDSLIPETKWRTLPNMPIHNSYLLQNACTKWAKQNGFNKWFVLGRISHETGMYKFKSDNTRNIN